MLKKYYRVLRRKLGQATAITGVMNCRATIVAVKKRNEWREYAQNRRKHKFFNKTIVTVVRSSTTVSCPSE